MWSLQARIAAFDADHFQSLGPGYLALSILGEAGEVADIVKKLWRTSPSIGSHAGFDAIPPESRERIGDEMADVIILSIVLANHLGLDLEEEVSKKLGVIADRLTTGYYGHEAREDARD